MRQIVLYPGEDSYWVVECPSLPGCLSQGRSKEDAIENIREAIALYEESLAAEGRAIPEDRYEILTALV